ncbi:MAG: hypothetical protein HQK54_05720 [Oligoflexales bacterium]|nr:hypothetical protein [Oligoflexales bacterium]
MKDNRGASYFFLSHVYKNKIADQASHLVKTLARKSLTIDEIVFSPREHLNDDPAEDQGYLNDVAQAISYLASLGAASLQVCRRPYVSDGGEPNYPYTRSSALVTEEGWSINNNRSHDPLTQNWRSI